MATNFNKSNQSLLDRSFLDDSYPIAKAVFGVGLWSNSVITTMFCTSALYTFATGNATGITVYIIGFVISLVFTIAQAYTVNKSPLAYTIFVLPDAIMTAIAWHDWFLGALFGKLLATPWQAVLASLAIGFVFGLVSARYPEKLVFGNDKKEVQ